MSSHTYQRASGHCGRAFSAAVRAALPGMNFKVKCGGATVISFISGLTDDQKNDLDKLVAGFSDLDEQKVRRARHIDARTTGLIGAGFVFEGVTISLSLESQTRIHGTYTARDLLTYPLDWNSLDDTGKLVLGATPADGPAEVTAFFQTALGTLRARIDTGTALKDAIRAATTRAELDAVLDER